MSAPSSADSSAPQARKDEVTGSRDQGGTPAGRDTRLAMALGPVTQSLDDQQALYIMQNPGKP